MMEFLQTYRVDIAIALAVAVALIVFRKTKVAKSIIHSSLMEIERKVNTDLAQKSIDEQVKILRKDKDIPFLIRKCITKYMIITILEKSMNFIADKCDIDREFDLKGNEEVTTVKVDLKDENLETTYKVSKGVEPKIDESNSETFVYGEVKAKTDFKGKDSAEISVGIKHKL